MSEDSASESGEAQHHKEQVVPSIREVCQSIREKHVKPPWECSKHVVAEHCRRMFCEPHCWFGPDRFVVSGPRDGQNIEKECSRCAPQSPAPKVSVPKRVALQTKFVHHVDKPLVGYWDSRAHESPEDCEWGAPKMNSSAGKPSAIANWHLARLHKPRYGYSPRKKTPTVGAKKNASGQSPAALQKGINPMQPYAKSSAAANVQASPSFTQTSVASRKKPAQAEDQFLPVICGPVADSHVRSGCKTASHGGPLKLPITHWWADADNSVRL